MLTQPTIAKVIIPISTVRSRFDGRSLDGELRSHYTGGRLV
ncbi:hypothetical protein [Leptolyngbya sp. AN10]